MTAGYFKFLTGVAVELTIDFFGNQIHLFVTRNDLNRRIFIHIEVDDVFLSAPGNFETRKIRHEPLLSFS